MSTHLKAPHGNQSPDEEPAGEKKKVLDLSVTQIAGGALAAMTAAALGSTLGLAGTIAGAAVASIVAGVAGSLYTASLRTGHAKVRTVFRGQHTDAASAPPAPLEAATTITAQGARGADGRGARGKNTTYYQPASDETTVLPAWDDAQPPGKPGSTTSKAQQKGRRGAFPWKRSLAITLSVFVLAALLITGYERVSGQTLSGGTGTTISQLGTSSGSDDTDTKSTPSASASSSDTPSASETASGSATPVAGSAPSASASESTESPSPSESESTPSETPSAAAGAGESAGTN